MSDFDAASILLTLVRVTTKKLYLMAYSAYQQWVFNRVRELREGQQLTFHAIATQLTSEHVLSPRSRTLKAEHVFSIYKKGKLRELRLTEEGTFEVLRAIAMR